MQLYNFMAKDNVPFHSVIFPSTLLGSDSDWTVVNHMSSTGWFRYVCVCVSAGVYLYYIRLLMNIFKSNVNYLELNYL